MASHLLNSRRFLPLLLTQFLGTLNDHFFKTAVVMLMTYRISDEMHLDPQKLVTLTGALYITPYMFFCATSGRLADKFDKARIARIIKLAEIGFMLVATVGFYYHLLGLLFVVLLCMGAHSAFFSPVKYALLPDHLRPDELMEGNAFIESCTFIAILLGTIAGGTLVLRPHGEIVASAAVLTVAFLGMLSSRFIPPATMCDGSVHVRFNIFLETWGVLTYVARRRELFKGSLANSWFWFVCVAFMTLFPAFTKRIIGADEDVATVFLTAFAVGLGLGTIACGATLKGKLSVRTVPVSAIAMSLFIFDLYVASPHRVVEYHGTLMTFSQFLPLANGWRMAFDLFMVAFCGGFYIVPLYAMLQQMCEPHHRARTMACNNVINAFFMVASASMALVMFAFGCSVADVFLVTGVLNLGVGLLLLTSAGKLVSGVPA
jgi:acyl-[acyl-carrier-protein]-phospholipid O-acyltransferase/long-chain-fatty-acid--[acyl-carrier-protein] ligase